MKKLFTISWLVLLFSALSINVYSQNIKVSGKITDSSTGESLPGVSVTVKGAANGTTSDLNGNFSISVSPNSSLTFTYIGYQSQTIALGDRTSLNVSLKAQNKELQEVVVVGYGTQRKLDVTGSVATIKGEEIAKQASINHLSALQGKITGVQIVNSGAPGASPQVTIRGTGTIYGNTKPLYVVDGVWYDDISFLNPADIESMSVLKDASSTSIYGLRASNGVILVSTKRGQKGKTTVNYNAYAGWQTVTNPVEVANATQYATLINELSASSGNPEIFADPESYGSGTDWYGQILRDAFVNNHQLSINGGQEKSSYNFSLGYLNQDGNVKTNNYERYTVKLNNDYQPAKNIKLGFSISGLQSSSKDIDGGIFRQLFTAGPVVPVYYADGSYGDPSDFSLGGGNNYNPQATIDFYNNRSKNYRYTGNVYGEIKFLKDFTFKTSFGGDFGQAETRGYTPVYTATLVQRNTISRLNVSRTETRNWIMENTLSYNKQLNADNNLTVLLGQTAQRYKGYSFNANVENVPYSSEGDLYLSLGDVGTRNVSDAGSLSTALSYFGRVNYSYKDKYLFNATMRADAGSQFFGSNLWAYLPSVGAGWMISNEDFMKDQNLFSSLKLRASWGKVGNAGVPINPTTQVVNQENRFTAIFNGLPYTGASVVTVVPPSIRVERGVGTDIGLEGSMLNSALTFELDYYIRKTQDAIFQIPISASVGTSSGSILGNQADFENRGFEISASWNGKIKKEISYSIGANFSMNNNKVLSVVTGENPIYAGGNGIANGALATRTIVGRPIGEFFGYKVAGIFQNESEIDGSAQPNANPGDFRYVDVNGDGSITGKDRVNLGSPNAKYTYGFNTNFTYKAFDLAIDFQGVAGVSIYNANTAWRYGNENFSLDFYNNRWNGEGTSNTYPSVAVGSTANAAPNSFYVESGAYFRVRNAQLGYTVPAKLLSKWNIQRIRLYANAQNPLNFFKYKGFSPEVGGGPTEAGIDANVYPLYATYNFGINVTF